MTQSVKRFAIVRETSAQSFESALNEKMTELRELNPTVTFSETGDYMTARIEYTERIEIPEETLSEKGIRFHCVDCPYFEPETKRDGSVDERKKWGGCKFAEMERTSKYFAACDVLYRLIENGEVSLCLTK